MPRVRLNFLSSEPIKIPTQEEIDQASAPYLKSLGRVVFAWNAMHEQLAFLFRAVAEFKHEETSYAVWHSTPSDLSQRKMLRAAVHVRNNLQGGKDKKMADILSLIDEVDSHSNRRNEAIHAVYITVTEAFGDGETTFEADSWSANPKSKYFENKDLIEEFDWRSDVFDAIAEHAKDMALHLIPDGGPEVAEDYPWPETLSLPRRGQKKIQPEPSHQEDRKKP